MSNQKKRRFTRLLVLLALLLLLAQLAAPAMAAEEVAESQRLPVLQLHQMVAGCADRYMLILDDLVIMVDCGSNSVHRVVPDGLFNYMNALGIDHVDYLFVTHYHQDHAMHIDSLMETYGHENSVVFGPSPELPRRYLPLPNGHYKQLLDNQELDIGPLHITCLGPEKPNMDGESNICSLNFLVEYGETCIFFTGDAVAASIVQRHAEELSRVDILKFPHHGISLSNTTIPEAAVRLMPLKVVLFPGNNPSHIQNYLTRLGKPDARRYSNASGNFVVLTDGVDIAVQTNIRPEDYGVPPDRLGHTLPADRISAR